jgi:DNA-binding XRE family transcriptional regulator
MPFIYKINVREEVEQLKREDPEFTKGYEIIEQKLLNDVRRVRKELGITQPDIARETGLSQQNISRMEKVGHSPTLRNFIRYLSGVGLEIEIKERKPVETSLDDSTS